MKTKLQILFGITLFLIVAGMSCNKPQMESACENLVIDDMMDSIVIKAANIFTPNGDGINDHFSLISYCIKNNGQDQWGNYHYVQNYNATITFFEIKKWNSGTVVYDGTGLANPYWDGKVDGEVCEGYYHYVITVATPNGLSKTYEGEVCSLVHNRCIKNTGECVLEDEIINRTSATNDPLLFGKGC